jgi:hypothetical protein
MMLTGEELGMQGSFRTAKLSLRRQQHKSFSFLLSAWFSSLHYGANIGKERLVDQYE